jgi:hypothetical protein
VRREASIASIRLMAVVIRMGLCMALPINEFNVAINRKF